MNRATAVGLLLPFAACAAPEPARAEPVPAEPVEGQLAAASCALDADADADCDRRALASGVPAVLRTPAGPVVLLLDGRLLGHVCAPLRAPPRARAIGLRLDGGRSMAVHRLETFCGGRWRPEDLPHTGVSEGDDE